jgi:hypothetical protein
MTVSNEVGLDDGGYYDAFCRMFEQALNAVMALPEAERQPLLDRLEERDGCLVKG